jgi:tRNA pseudouridine38-40 synthase
MGRYFLELAYQGTRYSGFQVQENALTVQSVVEEAIGTVQRQAVSLTGSSRTDAGVHARQNFFHFDFGEDLHPQLVYKLNAILPPDIAVRGIYPMPAEAHSRFDAVSRAYTYRLHIYKDPFLREHSLYFPFPLQREVMQEAAALLLGKHNFFAFAKTNSQVRNFLCTVKQCDWTWEGEEIRFTIEANRFLRGMVRLLTATMLRLGRGQLTLNTFKTYLEEERKCGYSVPAHGLYLEQVRYPDNYFPAAGAAFKDL